MCISKQMIFFFMGISSRLLAFKSNLCRHLDLKKYPKSIPHFLRVGDDFSYENKLD